MRWALCATLAALAGPLPLAADAERDVVTGGIEVGYRDVSVTGNEDKYREDVNLDDQAVRLFGLDLSWSSPASRALDDLTLEATGLGGEPHASARLRARKVGRWDLRADYRSSEFFYRDAGYFFREDGDLHAWDAKRHFYALDARVHAAEWITLRAGADRKDRDGHSTTSRNIQQDVFPLQRPVDQTATTYWLGADLRAGWADITLEHRLSSYENRWLITSGASAGEEPSGSVLENYGQLQTQEGDAPTSRLSVAGQPTDWLHFSAAYARTDAELDYRVDGSWSGLDWDDTPGGAPPEPYETLLTNGGRVERTVDILTADLAVKPIENVEITIEGARRSYAQDGTIDWTEIQEGGKQDGTYRVRGALHDDLDLDALGVAARWDVLDGLSLSAGIGYEKRSATFAIAGPEVETERTIYRAGLRYRHGDRLDLGLALEQGSDDGPYTPASPTDLDRVRADVVVRPGGGTRLALHFRDETRQNDLSYPLGMATDDVPPAASFEGSRADVTAWGASFGWQRGDRVDLDLGYDRTEIRSDADLVYVTGSTFVPIFDVFTTLDPTRYVSDQDAIHGRLRVSVGGGISLAAAASLVSNEGTFPLDWNVFGAEARWTHATGLFVRLAFDRYELDETNPYAGDPAAPNPDVNDYDADLWTVALGYRF